MFVSLNSKKKGVTGRAVLTLPGDIIIEKGSYT